MNLKIALTAVLLISGGSYVCHAQKSTVAQTATASTAKAFEKKISAYQKEADASKSAALLSELKQEMTGGMSSLKSEIVAANTNGDKEAFEKLMKKNDLRTTAFNETMQISRADASNKTAIVTALKKYAQTL
jgi:uncharacterized protein (DUF849 family)